MSADPTTIIAAQVIVLIRKWLQPRWQGWRGPGLIGLGIILGLAGDIASTFVLS